MLDESTVDNAARRRVDEIASAVLDEEALSDSLVHNDQSDLGRCGQSILHLAESLPELLNLLVYDLRAHSVADTVAEDDEVGGELAVVVGREDVDSLFEGLSHLSFDDLLAFWLDDVLRVVLAELAIGAGCEADDGLRSGVAHIDADEHGSHGVERFRELQVEEISLDLRVDLAQDIRSLAQVELESIADSDHLGWDPELGEQLLVHPVVALLAEHDADDLGVAEDAIGSVHHVAEQLALHLIVVVLGLELDPVRLLDSHLQLPAGLLEVVEDCVGDLEVGPLATIGSLWVLVDHDPLLVLQVNSLLDGQSLERLLIALDDLARLQELDLRSTEAEAVERDGILLNLNTPVLHRSLVGQGLHHLLDLSDFVRG